MLDWIIEADIYRLRKELDDTEAASRRHALAHLIIQKRNQLAKATGNAVPATGWPESKIGANEPIRGVGHRPFTR